MVVSKEYRIPLPLTVDEYRIAQLYMLAKKSRQESHGAGSGIEILVNEPYEDGPGPEGRGQYTRKVYHVGSHLPAWVKSLIPKSALSVEEEAWNAYPYTKTRFTCPFVERFSIEVETSYHNDGGHQDNVFGLSSAELKQREVDTIDIVKDQLYGADYVEEEDPTRYRSQKTGRGPLNEDWIREYWNECKGRPTPLPNGKAIMCAYKLCKVEFRYWGMQTKIEKFIHDSALRKTMLRAHRQAWAWLDEWWWLTIEDIRAIEKETQEILARKYAAGEEVDREREVRGREQEYPDVGAHSPSPPPEAPQPSSQAVINDRTNPPRDKLGPGGDEDSDRSNSSPRVGHHKDWGGNPDLLPADELGGRNSWSRSASRNTLSSHSQASWRMESIRRDSMSSESEDEFFDCQASVVPTIKEDLFDETSSLHKWSSLELLPQDSDETSPQPAVDGTQKDIISPSYRSPRYPLVGPGFTDGSVPPSLSPAHQPFPCDTTVLLLVVHAGSVLDSNGEVTNKKSDVTTFRGAFESVIRQHYPHLSGRVCIRLIPAPPVCAASLSVVSSLAPHGLDPSLGEDTSGEDQVPVGALPILGTLTKEYEDGVGRTVKALNDAYHGFLESEEGNGFCGEICVIGDSVGGVLCYDALCRGVDPVHRAGEPPSPGQYLRPRHSPSFPFPHSLPPPPSPTITVSHHFETRRESRTLGGGRLSISRSSLMRFPHSCPVTPESQSPLTPPQYPPRKVSDPLVSCRGADFPPQQRKTSAPSAFSGSSGSLRSVGGGQTPPFPTPPLAPALRPDGGVPPAGDDLDADATKTSLRKSCGGRDANSCSTGKVLDAPPPGGRSASESDSQINRHPSTSSTRRRSSGSEQQRIEFDVNDMFLFGCPLGLVLVYRRMMNYEDKANPIPRPACQQVYNMFHPTDPLAVRLEPLLSARFSLLPPITIPRYTKYPLGDGQPTNLLECIHSHGAVFHTCATPASNSNVSQAGSPPLGATRRLSDSSITSAVSGMVDSVSIVAINALSQRWWGTKRLDFALYCPEGLANFPSNVLPHLFHASYWESLDVVAFIIRQLVRSSHCETSGDDKGSCVFLHSQPREKWQKKRTSVKIKNIAANHRGNDIIVQIGAPQHIQARFMYGPLDMVALSGEKVDVHVRRDPPTGDWQLLGTSLTDKGGRLSMTLSQEKRLSCGVYPIKMIVRGDHTTCNLHMAVVPPRTEVVVFSIDGSFTASVSVTGRDPKVRAGAVDVVRHWQELGYLILYITGRPDMQQQKVVSWLAQHNFPHGLVSFADGLSTDPLGHKADYLRTIIKEAEVVVEAAYGSAKDIGVYGSLGLSPERIFIVGKASKKQAALAQVLADGYAAHLAQLSALDSSRPARVNPQMSIPKGFFGLPGQTNALRRRRSAKRTSSYPVLGSLPNEGILESCGTFSQSQRPNHMSMKC